MQKIIFLHIPKNAGSTIRDITRRQYSPKGVFTIPSGVAMESTLEQLEQLSVHQSQKIQLIEGHFGFGTHELIAQPATYFTFLRKPVDRFISAYSYIKQTSSHEHHQVIKSQNFSLDDYVNSNLIKEQALDNIQVRFLSGKRGRINRSNLRESALEEAKANLKNSFVVVGLVEEFEKSLLLLKKKINWKNVFYISQNRSHQNQTYYSENTLNLIKELNQLDLRLYEYGCELFKSQIENEGSQFIEEVEQFKSLNQSQVGHFSGVASSAFSKIRKGLYKYTGV